LAKVPIVGLQLTAANGLLLVEVWDTSTTPPEVQQQREDAMGGRGLFLVAMLAEQWAYYLPEYGGKVVWAKLALPDDREHGDAMDGLLKRFGLRGSRCRSGHLGYLRGQASMSTLKLWRMWRCWSGRFGGCKRWEVTRTNKGAALADSTLDELTLTELVDLVLLDRGSDKAVMVGHIQIQLKPSEPPPRSRPSRRNPVK
jgi:hypothetical protein